MLRNRWLRIIALLCVVALLSGCDTGLKQMGATEHGVRFRMLPPVLGGGVGSTLIAPGEMVVVYPWDVVYRFDTSIHDVHWAAEGSRADDSESLAHPEIVYTRARDGNEVALAVTVSYQINPEPAKLVRLISEVGSTSDDVRNLVIAVGRADIRTYMNVLTTDEFANEKLRNEAIESVRKNMARRLDQFGIEVVLVKLDKFQFERLLRNGEVDSAYQQRISSIQTLTQKTEREKLSQKTVGAQKEQELKAADVAVTTQVEEARGVRQQLMVKGKGYLQVKENEAAAIRARGESEVKGLAEQIKALAGAGGRSILRLDLVEALLKSNPSFVIVDQGSGKQAIDVNRTDANELISQLGVLEGLKDAGKNAETKASAKLNAAREFGDERGGEASHSTKSP